MNLEDDLRSALHRRPPPRDLLPGIQARLASSPRPPRRLSTWHWLPALVAVLILLTGLGVLQWRGAARRQARADAQQLAQALQLASNKLVHVRAQVVDGAYK